MITALDLSFRYPGSKSEALSKLEFELPPGGFGLLLAASGGGKSTLIKLITSLLKPTSGTLEVLGNEMSALKRSSEFRRSVGLVSSEVGLIPDRTLAENIALPLEFAGVASRAKQERVLGTIHRFGLDSAKHEMPLSVSEGQRRRTMLARALVTEPRLLILDEPTFALDPSSSALLWDLLFREHQRGMTILAAVSCLPDDPRFASCLIIDLDQRSRNSRP